MSPLVTALVVAALVAGLALVVALVVRELVAADVVALDRPGSDDQWSDLADAMRRYRRHKLRGRARA